MGDGLDQKTKDRAKDPWSGEVSNILGNKRSNWRDKITGTYMTDRNEGNNFVDKNFRPSTVLVEEGNR